jgi:hypothetical protein
MLFIFLGKQVIFLRFLKEVEPFFINEHKVKKKSLNLGSPSKPYSFMSTHHFNLVFLFICEVWFDANRVAPKQTFFQIPLYPRFAQTKFTRHIFYGHSLFERNVVQLFQINRDCLTATGTLLSTSNHNRNVMSKLDFTLLR